MRFETTPVAISEEVKQFCKSICNEPPQYVSVMPEPGATPHNCFPNVDKKVEISGGKRVNGWAIWQLANVYIEAEAHAVWQNNDMSLIDITPHDDGEKQIVFLQDPTLRYQGKKIPSKKAPLTNSPLAHEYVALSNETQAIILEHLSGERITPEDPNYQRLKYIYNRQRELNALFKSSAGRNEPCPCGSGLKYKKCCGRYD